MTVAGSFGWWIARTDSTATTSTNWNTFPYPPMPLSFRLFVPTTRTIEYLLECVNVLQLSVTMSYLWLLTEDGQIYVRAGNSHPVGNGWVQLSTLQFQPTNCLCHVALGLEVAWACDQRGHVYYRCGENGPPTLMPPAWIQLDPIDIFFQKVAMLHNRWFL